jgi:FdrA protein
MEKVARREPTSGEMPARSLAMALAREPRANLVLVSTPGEYAAAEAEKALRLGLHVMLFSDNIPLADEIALKRLARARGLLVMGPDCDAAMARSDSQRVACSP